MNTGIRIGSIVAAAGFTLTLALPARADVRVTLRDGLVTVMAKDATIRQILTEWAKVGQATIVNADRIGGGPITIELTEVPEKQALDVILRSVSGYLAAPRATIVPNASRFDRILILPSAVQPRPATASVPVATPPPQQRPFQLQPFTPEFEEVPGQPGRPGQTAENPNGALDPARRQPQLVPSVSQPSPVPAGAAPVPIGTAVPGVVLPPPTPAQPGTAR